MADIPRFLSTLPTASHLRLTIQKSDRAQQRLNFLKSRLSDSQLPNDQTQRRIAFLTKTLNNAPRCEICKGNFTYTQTQLHPGMCCRRDRAVICHPSEAARKHVYHESCLGEWLAVEHTCPDCREPLMLPYWDKVLVRRLADDNFVVKQYMDEIFAPSDGEGSMRDSFMGLMDLLRERVMLYAQGMLSLEGVEYCPYTRMRPVEQRSIYSEAEAEAQAKAEDEAEVEYEKEAEYEDEAEAEAEGAEAEAEAEHLIDATPLTINLWSWFLPHLTLNTHTDALDAFNHPLAIALFCRATRLLENNDGLMVTQQDFYEDIVQDLIGFDRDWPEEVFERPIGWEVFEGHLAEEMTRQFCGAPSSDAFAAEGEEFEMGWGGEEHVRVLMEEVECLREDLELWRDWRVGGGTGEDL